MVSLLGMPQMQISPELGYIALLFALFVVPKAFQRFGLPGAVTSLGLGAVAGLGFGVLQHDTTVHLLASFGIAALFLFAGLEVDLKDLRQNAGVLAQHLVVRALLLAGVAWAVVRLLGLDPRPATLLSLALLTPSTGFILDTIGGLELAPAERRWIKSKAIATELLALLVLFGTLQSTTVTRMAVSVGILAGMIVLLPIVFRAFAVQVVPFAPRSEFAFLIMIAVVSAYVTRELGVYYLVGAFVVGMAAQRFREQLPAIASENMIHAVEMFASFFVPFYFFFAGLQLRRDDVNFAAIGYGALFLVSMVPLRFLAVAVHRKLALRESFRSAGRVAIAMMPTLVFGLVLAEILRDRFRVPASIFGGLILYTLATTLLPGLIFRRAAPAYLEPHAPQLELPEPPAEPGTP